MTAPTDEVASPAGEATGEAASGRLGPPPGLALVFLLPALLLLGALVIYPIVYSVYRSLLDAAGSGFVGVDNYVSVISDRQNLIALRNNVIWVVVAPAVITVLGLIFAVLTERVRWVTAFKMIVFMPMAISLLASGVIFRLVYEQDPAKGVSNAVIVAVHDTFAGGSKYPGAGVRPNAPAAARGGAISTEQAVQPGQSVAFPLIRVRQEFVPQEAANNARRPPVPAPGAIGGAVWFDFTRGGGGTPNVPNPGEKGLPDVTVQAVRDGEVVATEQTRADGTFSFTNLPAGPYTLTLPRDNFTEPYRGLTWLGPSLITPSIIGAFIWVWAGFAMVLIAAGLAAIPRDALEAARVDGATEWQVFRRVTVPLLAPVLTVVLVTLVIYALKVFDLVFIIAPGSVQPQADVLALEMWRVSFGGGNNQGLGSALAIFLLLLVLPAMIFNIRRFRREQS